MSPEQMGARLWMWMWMWVIGFCIGLLAPSVAMGAFIVAAFTFACAVFSYFRAKAIDRAILAVEQATKEGEP
jgi:hypothetical protein